MDPNSLSKLSCVQIAFSALKNHHILAVPGIACCPACSSTQIDIVSECPECRHDARGYVMCCHQDMRQAEEEGTLMLSFGVFSDTLSDSTLGPSAMDAHHDNAGHVPQQHQDHDHAHSERDVHSLGGDEEEEEEDPVYAAACKEVGLAVVEVFQREGLTVEWDGEATSRIAVKSIPQGPDRLMFKLDPEQAEWVDKISQNRLINGMPSEARCSHTCGSGVRPCPHGVCMDFEEDPECACCH
ncbi:hypothetical protein CEUSTIGMA_g4287.t1 [Chlamydomonas eustigma]|uniref:DUF6891 domain-containing protein n=1 Tax=Chlamydomonas eustigma TaxID=1157962 RepID=A0A250X186_9CHLO|nr:hypothetical protein CEUSTIGMA_g4287.t1 [Chlamydomonas eustigma]|eukprot:GAX76841.1 hypothetical protein CEUSTIGMA_g4287.t1 [Chlamydomonas eustigma]